MAVQTTTHTFRVHEMVTFRWGGAEYKDTQILKLNGKGAAELLIPGWLGTHWYALTYCAPQYKA